METLSSVISDLLNSSWFGSVLGLIGIVLTLEFFRRGRSIARLSYQQSGDRLIGGSAAALPIAIEVRYNGVPVPQVTKTTVVLWNSGTTTVRGADVVEADPLRIALVSEAEILDVQVSALTRQVTAVTASVDPAARNVALVRFDFLDAGDGATIEVLHTGDRKYADVAGTVRGISHGCADWGVVSQPRLFRGDRKDPLARALALTLGGRRPFVLSLTVLLGALGVFVGLFPDLAVALVPALGKIPSSPVLQAGKINWAPILLGLFYMIPGGVLLWTGRRRFPRALEPIDSR